MAQPVGRTMPLSLPRRFICDLLHFCRKVPSVPVQRRLRLPEVVAARALARPRPSWCAIFTKAYALVTAARPALRRTYFSLPTPHLFEHAANVATIAVERSYRGEDALFFVRLHRPETQSLHEIDEWL